MPVKFISAMAVPSGRALVNEASLSRLCKLARRRMIRFSEVVRFKITTPKYDGDPQRFIIKNGSGESVEIHLATTASANRGWLYAQTRTGIPADQMHIVLGLFILIAREIDRGDTEDTIHWNNERVHDTDVVSRMVYQFLEPSDALACRELIGSLVKEDPGYMVDGRCTRPHVCPMRRPIYGSELIGAGTIKNFLGESCGSGMVRRKIGPSLYNCISDRVVITIEEIGFKPLVVGTFVINHSYFEESLARIIRIAVGLGALDLKDIKFPDEIVRLYSMHPQSELIFAAARRALLECRDMMKCFDDYHSEFRPKVLYELGVRVPPSLYQSINDRQFAG